MGGSTQRPSLYGSNIGLVALKLIITVVTYHTLYVNFIISNTYVVYAEANTHGLVTYNTKPRNNLGSENGIAGVDRILGRFLVIWQRHPGTRTPSHYPAAGQPECKQVLQGGLSSLVLGAVRGAYGFCPL